MDVLQLSISGLCLISLCLNAYLVYRLKTRISVKESFEVRDLLHELTGPGGAVLQIKVIDKSSILLRAPRG